VAGFLWIEWQPSYGLGGRHPWNMHFRGVSSPDEISNNLNNINDLKFYHEIRGNLVFSSSLISLYVSDTHSGELCIIFFSPHQLRGA